MLETSRRGRLDSDNSSHSGGAIEVDRVREKKERGLAQIGRRRSSSKARQEIDRTESTRFRHVTKSINWVSGNPPDKPQEGLLGLEIGRPRDDGRDPEDSRGCKKHSPPGNREQSRAGRNRGSSQWVGKRAGDLSSAR